MRTVVLDASVAVAFLLGHLPEEAAARVAGMPLVSLAHLDAEVLSALARLHRHQALADDTVPRALSLLAALPIDRLPVHESTLHRAWAMRHNVAMGDALYVAIAEQLGSRVLTTDRRLRRAAPTLTVAPDELL